MRWSEINTFNTCPFKYKLQKDGWFKQDDSEESAQKIFGQAIHKGLETHYNGQSFEDVKKAFLSLYPKALTDKMEYSVESGLLTLENYLGYYKEQDTDWKILATEKLGKVETITGSHELHIDLIAKHIPTGSIYFFDHKTTSKSFSPMYWRKYEIDSQMSRYTKYIIDEYGSCAGALINGIAVGYRKKAYRGEPAGFWQKFERQIFNRTEQALKDWMESDANWEAMIKLSVERNCFPKALGSICSFCEFYQFCASGCEDSILETLYEKKSN